MDLLAVARDVPQRGTGNLVAIGKWDGVHLAHQTIISALVAEARSTAGQAVVMGFHPLPMAVLRPDKAPPVLQTLEERAEVMAALGVDVHLALPFNREFADMTPEEFVRDVLVDQLKASQVMVGFNNTFGRGGKGTAETLTRLCEPYGIPVHIFPPVRCEGESVSSSEVRLAVAGGEMERAARLLGRFFSITGAVVHGDKRGRQIGYPTANISLAAGRQLPANGVYVARVTILDPADACKGSLPCEVTPRTGPSYGAMLNLGWRPTFQGRDLRCEAHLLDFQGDLYGKELRVEFLHRLRTEQTFKGIDALKAQLAMDEAQTRDWLVDQHG
ncbi:MAG: riboflavin kinase/FMN adenylyltransferase [Firmicutes bacterium]|nr:riboflavin kinase/FMN adenylyltransferase [Bacillota bacterium]